MCAHVFWFSMAIVGINVGWQPLPEGGMEYIIQLDPQTLEALKAGETIHSDVPPSAGEVRAYKIVSGTKKLPRINLAEANSPPPAKLADRAQLPSNPTQTATADQSSKFSSTPLPEAAQKPLIASPAAYLEQAESSSGSAVASPKHAMEKEEPAKPWMPLIVTALGLFASFGGNVYLVWIFADLRRRYRMLQSKAGGATV